MKVTLTKLRNLNDVVNPLALRTQKVEGVMLLPPEEGSVFEMASESLTPGAAFRLVTTSLIQKVTVKEENRTVFQTLNSEYELTW